MNLKQFYLATVIAGLVTNNYSEIKSYVHAVREAKEHLVFKKDLSMESKMEYQILKNELKHNLIAVNLQNLMPVYNIYSSMYQMMEYSEGYLNEDYISIATEVVDNINEIELRNRMSYYEILKSVISEYNLQTDMNLDDACAISYKKLREILKYFNMNFNEYFTDDSIIREVDDGKKTMTFTKHCS